MFKKVLLLLLSSSLLLSNSLFSQTKKIAGIQNFEYQNSKALEDQFEKFEVFEIDVADLQNHVRSNGSNIQFDLELGNSINWPTVITPQDIRGNDYKLITSESIGSVRQYAKKEKVTTFRGYHQNGKQVRLTINDDYLYGYYQLKNEKVFIEPLWYFENDASKNLFVVYSEKDVIIKENQTCAVTEMNKGTSEWETTTQQQSSGILACYEVTVYLAADWAMNTKYNGVAGAENHMFGVLNNVAGNYDDEFQHDLILFAGTTFVSNCSTCDPWTTSTGASTLLNSFRSWGNGNGFGDTNFDVATLWTNRNLSGSTIGIAWVGGVCSNSKYNVCQDFSSNANALRVLQAHELGHNFDANHDASGSNTIMAPSVNSSTSWSTASINAINSFVNFRVNQGGCFISCGGGGGFPPVADFISDHTNSICEGTQVNFTDLSQNNPDQWDWDFQGGTPTTSTQQNPSINYNIAGSYDVTLIASNVDGSDTRTEFGYVMVEEYPFADFTYTNTLATYEFFDFSSGSPTTYLWDFGDGIQSFVANPIHTYFADGFYTVSLTVTNGCSTDTYSDVIEVVTPPTANFTSDVVDGCEPLTINFFDQSSFNTNSWEWDFPGATPNTSFDQNPTVTYTTAGTYDVTLTVYNSQFQDAITKTGYITVQAGSPIADFSFTTTNNTVAFTNSSQNTDTYDWDFGDGNTSSSTDPIHDYANDGTYYITLTSSSGCGSDTKTDSVTIITPPIADFDAVPFSGCAPLSVQFNNNSTSNVSNFEWTFPGGNPSTSTDEFPTVEYATPGDYSVTLKVSNSLFADSITRFDYIEVEASPVSSFTYSVNNTTVAFTNTSQNFFTQTWDFGDGNTSNAINPTHTYANFGSYDVDLIIENSCGLDTITQTVLVTSAPVANFTGTPTNGCSNLSVQFDGQNSTNASSYQWTFPGGNPATSTLSNPTVNYPAQGSYDVTLIVTNTLGSDTLENLNYISVNDVATAAFSTSVVNRTVTFTNTSTNFSSVTWDFGDGNTSSQNNPTHTYNSDGTYSVTITTTNPCGNSTVTNAVSVSTMPSAGFVGNLTSGCAPFGVNFTNQASANTVSYQWSFPGGNPATSNQPNPTVNYPSKGTYDVTLIVSNSVGNDTLTLVDYITVNDKPVTNYSYSVANFTQVNFTNGSVDANNYVWYFGNGDSTTVASPNYNFSGDGVYNVELRAFNGCGFTSQTQQITIVTPPTAEFNTSQGTTSGCTPLQIQYNSLASANTVSYQWTFPGGNPATSTQANPLVSYATAGTYNVSLQVTNTAGNDTETKTNYISVSTTPTAGFSTTVANDVVTITNSSTGGNSVAWNFGDGNTSSQNSPTHTYSNDGTYTITQSVTNGCGTVTSTQQVTIVTIPSAAFSGSVTDGCSPLSVQYNNQSSVNATSYAWTFMGGNPQTSVMANPTVAYNSKGSYDVQLIVTNSAGNDTLLLTNYITVNDVPTANFTSNANMATVQFTNGSTDATSYSWDFGDGNSSNMMNPNHTYGADGSYTVTLSATNNCGTVTSTQSVSILTPPTAGFSSAATSGCEPFSTSFTNQSSANANSFEWIFAGGNPATSSDMNPTVTFSAAGSYDVTLIAINSLSRDTLVLNNYINVQPLPTSDFSSNINLAVAQFNSTSVNATSYSWDFGDGNTSSMENPTHTYGADGVYTVTLTTTNNCGSITSQQNVAIAFTAPIALFSASATTGCAPFTVDFNNMSSSNSTSYVWNFPGGTPATSTDVEPSVTYSAAGSYTVELIAINSIGNDTSIQTDIIVVEDIPTVDFNFALNVTTATFTNNTQNGSSVSWDFGDGTTSDLLNPTHTFAGNGNYNVVLTASNNCGMSSISQTVSISGSVPGVDFTADKNVICMGSPVAFMDNSTNNPTAWNWTFAGGTPANSTDQNPTVVYNAPGDYEVILEATNAYGNGSLTRNSFITVQEMPTVDFNYTINDLIVDFGNNATGADSYAWDFGDGNTSSDENPTHTYNDIGDYTVTLTVTNSCGSVNMVQIVSVTSTSLNDLANFDQFNIYPNPNDGTFTVELEGLPSEMIEFNVMNNIGQLIHSEKSGFRTGQLKQVIRLDVAQGIYMLRIRTNDGFVSRKIEIH